MKVTEFQMEYYVWPAECSINIWHIERTPILKACIT